MTAARLAFLPALAVLAAGCASSPARVAGPQNVPSVSPDVVCPSVAATRPDWPTSIPARVPRPEGASITSNRMVGTATYVIFNAPLSLRQGTLFVVSSLRSAGFTVGRGDAEATETDAPFSGTDIVGAYRLTKLADCQTQWTLAILPRNAAPPALPSLVPHQTATPTPTPATLIPYTPGASASALPTG